MFSRCANSKCARPFDYHIGGKFYRFRQDVRAPECERNTHEVVHFWLCPHCAEIYALDFDGTHCLLIQPAGHAGTTGEVLERRTEDDEGWRGAGNEGVPLDGVIARREKGALR